MLLVFCIVHTHSICICIPYTDVQFECAKLFKWNLCGSINIYFVHHYIRVSICSLYFYNNILCTYIRSLNAFWKGIYFDATIAIHMHIAHATSMANACANVCCSMLSNCSFRLSMHFMWFIFPISRLLFCVRNAQLFSSIKSMQNIYNHSIISVICSSFQILWKRLIFSNKLRRIRYDTISSPLIIIESMNDDDDNDGRRWRRRIRN